MHRVGVCVHLSHNSTTVGHRVQPSCSLLGHSVRWYTNLIHFALALTLNSLSLSLSHSLSVSLSLQFRVTMNSSKLQFVAHAVALMFCISTQPQLILEIAILARGPISAPWP